MDREELGALGERIARRHLRSQGCRILATRWRCPLGELDIVARDGETLIFVEVKTRRSAPGTRGPAFGPPEEAVTAAKRRKVALLAAAYLSRHPIPAPCRFDVVAVVLPGPASGWREAVLRLFLPFLGKVRHIRGAFRLGEWEAGGAGRPP